MFRAPLEPRAKALKVQNVGKTRPAASGGHPGIKAVIKRGRCDVTRIQQN